MSDRAGHEFDQNWISQKVPLASRPQQIYKKRELNPLPECRGWWQGCVRCVDRSWQRGNSNLSAKRACVAPLVHRADVMLPQKTLLTQIVQPSLSANSVGHVHTFRSFPSLGQRNKCFAKQLVVARVPRVQAEDRPSSTYFMETAQFDHLPILVTSVKQRMRR